MTSRSKLTEKEANQRVLRALSATYMPTRLVNAGKTLRINHAPTFSDLEALSKEFKTKDINIDSETESGCDTCGGGVLTIIEVNLE